MCNKGISRGGAGREWVKYVKVVANNESLWSSNWVTTHQAHTHIMQAAEQGEGLGGKWVGER